MQKKKRISVQVEDKANSCETLSIPMGQTPPPAAHRSDCEVCGSIRVVSKVVSAAQMLADTRS